MQITNKTKIFFCDFDGTLGTSEKNISPRTRAALDGFVERGNIFVLSSGRAMSDVKNLAKKLNLNYPCMFLSAYNGAEVCSWPGAKSAYNGAEVCSWPEQKHNAGEEESHSCSVRDSDNPDAENRQVQTYYRLTVPFDTVKTSFRLAAEHGLYCQTYDGDEIVVPAMAPETEYYTTYVKMPVRVEPLVSSDPASVLRCGEPSKCLVIHLDNPSDHRIEPFEEELEKVSRGTIHTVMSNPYYLEIDPVNATKAYSLKWLCNRLGIDIRNSIAAGDAQNDNPMLKAAGVGIGMCNGLLTNPEMKEAADIITAADNDHDGLAEILEKL